MPLPSYPTNPDSRTNRMMRARKSGPAGPRDTSAHAAEQISTQILFDRTPPRDLECEMCLLGSLILEPKMVLDAQAILTGASDFYDDKHAAIYQAIIDLYDKTGTGDLAQMISLLRDRQQLERCGGVDYLEVLANSVPAATNAPHFARIVSDKARVRRLIDTAGQIIYDAYHIGQDVTITQVIDQAAAAVNDLALSGSTSHTATLEDELDAVLRRAEVADGSNPDGIATGYYDLDIMVPGGLKPGDFVVIGARPSMGKTSLATNIAEQICACGGENNTSVPTLIISREMKKTQIVERILAARSGINLSKFRSNTALLDTELRSALTAGAELKTLPLLIDDAPQCDIASIRAKTRQLVQQHGIRVVIIDYLQLLESGSHRYENRTVEVGAISRGLKKLANELSIVVICLAQLNRASTEHTRPRMSDLRESGSIEQDADIVMLLHREEYYHKADPQWALDHPDMVGIAELIIDKQRSGPTGVVKLRWLDHLTRFVNAGQQTHHALHNVGSIFDAAQQGTRN